MPFLQRLKKDHWQPLSIDRILHPQNDDLTLHLFENADGTLTGLTPTGTFHIGKLRLNRPQLVARRQSIRRQREAQARQNEMEQRLAVLEERMAYWERRFTASGEE